MICWTLGITEHHNAVDNVLALINLALLTGHVGRYGSGLNPLRGQTNCKAAEIWALCQTVSLGSNMSRMIRYAPNSRRYGGRRFPLHAAGISVMFAAMGRKELTALYVIGENPAQSEADVSHAMICSKGLSTSCTGHFPYGHG